MGPSSPFSIEQLRKTTRMKLLAIALALLAAVATAEKVSYKDYKV